MDTLIKGYSEKAKLRFTHVDVTGPANALSERHLCGATSCTVLGRALAAVSLMTADMTGEDERVTLRMQVDGPLKGLLVEGSATGGLRGYTNVKVLNDLDESDSPDIEAAMGESANVQIVRSSQTAILFQAALEVEPADIRLATARYFNHSMQTPAGVEIAVAYRDQEIASARAIVAERMPDGSSDDFICVLEQFENGNVGDTLIQHEGITPFATLFELPDLSVVEEREQCFVCRCSREKVVAVLQTLEEAELREMINEDLTQDIYCDMCGKGYVMRKGDFETALETRSA